jgi:hypothetical protein
VQGGARAARARARTCGQARSRSKVTAAIAAISQHAWTGIRYPRAIWDDQLSCWVSDAQVTETEYTTFTSKKGQAITARLIVRRVRDLNKQAAAGQDELFPAWRYHAVFADSPFELVQAEEQHRDRAIVEQVFADWTDGPLAHLPSGVFPANAAWLACVAIAHNLLRAAGSLVSLAYGKARGATIRRDLIDVAARTAPVRPRAHHAAPARRMAPRTRMDDPVHRRLRPASRRGLTRPDQVTTPQRPASPPDPEPRPKPRTSRRISGRQKAHSRIHRWHHFSRTSAYPPAA